MILSFNWNFHGCDLDDILHQYTTMVKPAYEEFCIPTKKYADIIEMQGVFKPNFCQNLVWEFFLVARFCFFLVLLNMTVGFSVDFPCDWIE